MNLTMPIRSRFSSGLSILGLVAMFVVCSPDNVDGQGADRRQNFGVASEFSYDSYDDDGNRTANVWGETGVLGEGGLDVTGLKLTTYKQDPDERIDLIIEVPTCRYEVSEKKLSSDDQVTAVSGDGRLKLEGRGIDWSDAGRTLSIRSQVRAIIVDTSSEDGRTVEIFSDRLDYGFDSGLIRFTDNVRVVDQPDFTMSADRIEARMREGASEPDRIMAKGNVVIDARLKKREISMTGDTAEYEATLDGGKIARMPGGAKWTSGFSGGRSDVLEMDLDRQSFVGTGMVVLSLRESEDDVPIDVMASSYTMSEDEVTFSGDVVAEQGSESRVACDEMAIALDADGDPETISAWGGVSMFIVRDDRLTEAFGERMRYEGIDTPEARVEISGEPSWRSGGDSGSGEVIEVFPEMKQFVARGNARARIAPRKGEAEVSQEAPIEFGNEAIDVTADRYEIGEEGAVFHENVAVAHPQWNLRSGVLRFDFSEEGRSLERVSAEEAVHFESLATDAGQDEASGDAIEDVLAGKPWSLDSDRLALDVDPVSDALEGMVADGNVKLMQAGRSAVGERLTYNPETELFTFSGSPALDDPEGMSFRGNEDTIIFASRIARTVTAEGWYRMKAPVDSESLKLQLPEFLGGGEEGDN